MKLVPNMFTSKTKYGKNDQYIELEFIFGERKCTCLDAKFQ